MLLRSILSALILAGIWPNQSLPKIDAERWHFHYLQKALISMQDFGYSTLGALQRLEEHAVGDGAPSTRFKNWLREDPSKALGWLERQLKEEGYKSLDERSD